MRYLFDTCTFLWLCSAPRRLSRKARAALSDPGAELLLSDVAVLEIALKWTAGKLKLPRPPRAWISEQTAIWETETVPITRETVFRTTELPDLHRDPFDRLLIATALEHGVTIMTPDPLIHRYPVAWFW